MKKLLAVLLVFVLCFGLMAGCGGTDSEGEGEAANEPIVVKVAHTDSSSRSTHVYFEKLQDYLDEHAPGKFQVEVYSDGKLGDTPDTIAGLGLGTVQIVFELASTFTQVAGDASACIDLPYLYTSYEDWIEGTFENGGLELFNETIKDVDFYCIDMYYNGIRQLISSSKIYHGSEDFAGQKIRIAQNDLNIEMWKAMGANPTPMSWGEVVTSLSQGQIDALDHSLGVFNDFNLHEIAPYVTITNHATSPFPIVCSLKWIESLDPADREVFEAGVKLIAAEQRDVERANEAGYIERFQAEGAEVYELTADEIAALQESCASVYDWMREKVGDEMMNKWLATVPQ